MSRQETVKPPYSNTGAQSTLGEGLRPLVDWVSATLKNITPDELIEGILLLNPEHFTDCEKGKYGYMNAKRYGHIAVYYNGHPEMGIHLEISGQGCREYESYQIMDWGTLFRVLLACEANITRLDVAIDDFQGYWDLQTIVRKTKRGELVSKFKHATKIEKIKIETGKTVGHTVYFGSAESRIRIRMYDKLLERIAEGQAVEGIDVWNRTEIQARKERAQEIAALIAEDLPIGQIVAGILKYYLRFVVRGKDSNKSRWKTARFWEEFLQGVETIRLARSKPEQSVEKKIAWLERQVAPTLALIVKAFEGDMKQIYKLINDGSRRLKPKDLALIQDFKDMQFSTKAYHESV